jgi:hypothetical protein
MSANNGWPAFPVPHDWRRDSGMTLRDYFAAKAMEGLIQSPDQVSEPFIGIAQSAYLMADAMLKARKP